MIVSDFDLEGVALAPGKANPPPVVDPNTILPHAVPAQAFQAVARNRSQSSQIVCRIEHVELSLGDVALLSGLAAMKLEVDGTARDLENRYTIIWHRTGADWQVVNWQSTAVRRPT